MTAREFIAKLQGYYGLTYPPGQRDDIGAYLADFGEFYLDALYQAAIRHHSASWKCLPDIAIFESKEVRISAHSLLEIEERKRQDRLRAERPAITDGEFVPREQVADFLEQFMAQLRQKSALREGR